MANESRGGGCGGVVALLSLPPLRDGFCSSRKVKFCVAEARYSGFHPLACLLAMSCFSVSSLLGALLGPWTTGWVEKHSAGQWNSVNLHLKSLAMEWMKSLVRLY